MVARRFHGGTKSVSQFSYTKVRGISENWWTFSWQNLKFMWGKNVIIFSRKYSKVNISDLINRKGCAEAEHPQNFCREKCKKRKKNHLKSLD